MKLNNCNPAKKMDTIENEATILETKLTVISHQRFGSHFSFFHFSLIKVYIKKTQTDRAIIKGMYHLTPTLHY